jgi:hypothetical protein
MAGEPRPTTPTRTPSGLGLFNVESSPRIEISQPPTPPTPYTPTVFGTPRSDGKRSGGYTPLLGPDPPYSPGYVDKPRRRRKTHKILGWWKELVGIFFGVVGMAGLVAILIYVHDQTLSRWTSRWRFVSINGGVAICGTICKIGLGVAVGSCLGQMKWMYFRKQSRPLDHFGLFDTAFDRPWTAMKALAKVRWALMYFALVISFTALAFDPFLQQIANIDMKEQLVIGDKSATIGITQHFVHMVNEPNRFGDFLRPEG